MSRPLPSRTAGLITAAGRATRLGRLPRSKELLPVGFMADPTDGQPRPKPVSLYLIEQMRAAGATQLGVGVVRLEPKEMNPRRGPWDWAWSFAAWRPTFSEFVLAEVSRLAEQARRIPADAPPPEWPFGTVIAAALGAGLHVDSVGDDHWRILDTGTPATLAAAADFPGVLSGR